MILFIPIVELELSHGLPDYASYAKTLDNLNNLYTFTYCDACLQAYKINLCYARREFEEAMASQQVNFIKHPIM